MPLDIATAVVQEAHRAGKPVFAHPSSLQGVEISIESGVDVLAHTAAEMGPWNAQLVARLRARHMALVPTLTLFEVENRKAGAPERIETVDRITTQQLKLFAEGGGLVLFGTDAGYIEVYDTAEEYRLMSRALGWRQILASLTVNPAQRFTHESGTLSSSGAADLTVLEGDPASDVTAFSHVLYTIRNGRIIYRRDRSE